MFQLGDDRKATAMRLDLVTKTSEQVVEFDVRDLDLPGDGKAGDHGRRAAPR